MRGGPERTSSGPRPMFAERLIRTDYGRVSLRDYFACSDWPPPKCIAKTLSPRRIRLSRSTWHAFPSAAATGVYVLFFTGSAKKLDDDVFIILLLLLLLSLLLYYIVYAYGKNSVCRSLSKMTTAVAGGVAFLLKFVLLRSYFIRRCSSFRFIREAPSYL